MKIDVDNCSFEDIFHGAGTLLAVTPLFDQMIGIPTLNYVMDTDEYGDLPIYRFVLSVYTQILFNHSTLECPEFDKIFKSVWSDDSSCENEEQMYEKLQITNPELTDDDRTLLKENRKEIEIYENALLEMRKHI